MIARGSLCRRGRLRAGLLCFGGLLAACGIETRGWVLSERDAASGPASVRDAGCPACDGGVVLVGESETPLHGSQGGMPYEDLCPQGEAAIGYRGSIGDVSASAAPLEVITSLQVICGALSTRDDGAVAISRAGTLPLRGTTFDLAWSQLCPVDQAIVGVAGRAGVALDQVAFVCARVAVTPADGGDAATASTTELAPAGGDGGSAFRDACPPGELARGHHLRAGRWIDAFGLVCARPAL